jgi:hypothetical protein
MNINLKLKQRREKINEILRHKRSKVMRKFKQVKKQEEQTENEDLMKNKIEKYLNVEKMIQDYDKKIGGMNQGQINIQQEKKNNEALKRENQAKKSNLDSNRNNIAFKNKNNPTITTSQAKKLINTKRERKTYEEIEKEKESKLNIRKSTYKKLNKKTPKGQPVMKFQVEHIFKKIKDKINKGLI